MNIGFETIGNATIIFHDQKPVLVTDPWLEGPAYMGSWILSHQIPAEQYEAIRQCDFIWISHGHPDHLSSQSLKQLSGKHILLPDHKGSRIYDGLKMQGHKVTVLPDRQWHNISPHLRVLSIADQYQDAILIADINGRVVVNFNDSSDITTEYFVRKIIKQFKLSFILRLSGYGDAAMINFCDENGKRLLNPKSVKAEPAGAGISRSVESFGATYFVPFSSMHRYQRADSIWANDFTVSLSEYSEGFSSNRCKILPAYIRWDCETDKMTQINPPESPFRIRDPKEFGDNWDDLLEKDDVKKIEDYFRAVEHLYGFLDYINFRCGKKDHIVEISKKKFGRGITFEVPRQSLMTAVQYEIFDDLLIGNFMRTILHGQWGPSKLYPDFTPYVARYADNGRAKTKSEIKEYRDAYIKRAGNDYWMGIVETQVMRFFRRTLPSDSGIYRISRDLYHYVKRIRL